MCKYLFRTLRADEIDVRVGQINEKGATLLLYKDARCDMNILDETLGPECWQREHYECKGNLFCRVGICVETKKGEAVFPEWIWKSDCGTESNTEAEKGESSDSFKRACVNIGIGRELYTAPFIYIPADKMSMYDKGNKKATNDKFTVTQIGYDDRRQIIELVIVNQKGDTVYSFKKKGAVKPKNVCSVCGAEVKAMKKPDGTIVQPEDVLKGCGGMCFKCYQAKANERNTPSEG